MPRHVACTLCGQNDTKVIQEAEKPYKVVKCRNCGLVYVNPQPDRIFTEEHYQEDYYKEWIEKQMEKRIPMWKRRLKELKKHRKSGRLLDVGCGAGTFLKLANEEGFEVYGTEISEYASRYVKDNFGINVFKGNLEEAQFPASSFEIVTIWHTLEHLPDPRITLKEVNRILKKDGLLVIAIPNLKNFITRVLYLLAKRKKLKLFSIKAKELHLFHFSAKSITLLLKETGFNIKKTALDLAQIKFSKKIVDYLAFVIHMISRKNLGESFKIYAVKI